MWCDHERWILGLPLPAMNEFQQNDDEGRSYCKTTEFCTWLIFVNFVNSISFLSKSVITEGFSYILWWWHEFWFSRIWTRNNCNLQNAKNCNFRRVKRSLISVVNFERRIASKPGPLAGQPFAVHRLLSCKQRSSPCHVGCMHLPNCHPCHRAFALTSNQINGMSNATFTCLAAQINTATGHEPRSRCTCSPPSSTIGKTQSSAVDLELTPQLFPDKKNQRPLSHTGRRWRRRVPATGCSKLFPLTPLTRILPHCSKIKSPSPACTSCL